MSVCSGETPLIEDLLEEATNTDTEPASLGTVRLRLTLPEDLAHFWRNLELAFFDAAAAGHATSDVPSFVAFLVASTLATWRGQVHLPAYGDIYLRGGALQPHQPLRALPPRPRPRKQRPPPHRDRTNTPRPDLDGQRLPRHPVSTRPSESTSRARSSFARARATLSGRGASR
jgi:hypothetical protein